MSETTRVTLRPGERIFINGAVLKAEGRVSFELLNDAAYLLENEIIHAQQTVTPLRQLYYILQTMVLEPAGIEMARGVYTDTMHWLKQTFTNATVLEGLERIEKEIQRGAPFQALKLLRALVPIEDAIMGSNRSAELRVVGAV